MTVTVVDDDAPGIRLSAASVELDEGAEFRLGVSLDTEPVGQGRRCG